VTIVSALDVDDDEGKHSFDTPRLTIFNDSNCLNCGVTSSLLVRLLISCGSESVSSNVILLIMVVVGVEFDVSFNKSLVSHKFDRLLTCVRQCVIGQT
jgi:hypothetical protein